MTGAIVATAIFTLGGSALFCSCMAKTSHPKGAETTAYINGDMTLDMTGSELLRRRLRRRLPSRSCSSSLAIDSTPAGDVEIDGAFVGNTPSTVTVAPQPSDCRQEEGLTDWTRLST